MEFESGNAGSGWQTPMHMGSARIWYDATNSVLRIKHGSNPSSETDGYEFMESDQCIESLR